MYSLKDDIETMFLNSPDKIRAKKKLNELFDKYGESKRAIENGAEGAEYMEYVMASAFADDVLAERRKARGAAGERTIMQRNPSSERQQDMEDSFYSDFEEEEEEEELSMTEQVKKVTEDKELQSRTGQMAVEAYKNLDKKKIREDTEKYLKQTDKEQAELMNELIRKFKIDMKKYGDGFSREYIGNMLGDERFQNAMNKFVRPNEGGKVNHKNDRGGLTNFGISSKYYPDEDVDKLTPQRASAIFYRDYWINTKIHQLPDELADIVFDDAVVQGQPAAIMNLQKALGVKSDGKIGSKTLNALADSNLQEVKKKFIENVHKREDLYIKNDSSQKVFERGHRNRYNKYY